MKQFNRLLTLFLTVATLSFATEYNAQFTPPAGWKEADNKELGPNVKIMVVGAGKNAYPPSINLVVEPFSGTVKDYLTIIKAFNEKNGDRWKSLGDIKTEAGIASLSQVEAKTKWGNERLMHVIVKKDENIYILTAAALQSEFAAFYKDFFNAFRSLSIKSVE